MITADPVASVGGEKSDFADPSYLGHLEQCFAPLQR
jgi:hypothetical protein